MTVARALQQTEMRLGQVSDAPALDAAWLLLHVLGTREASWLTAHADVVLTSAQIQNLETLTQRRAAGEPLAYILGEWEFYGRPFLVTPDVLIPRPATEALVDATLRYLRSPSILRNIEGRSDPLVVADVGTGSGCIAITLALELQTPSFSPLVRGRTKQAPPL
ncbi:MAG TPA: HemK/PrmC family methyltransferase, partial [Candidatus Andersenbacteria bacterium]|nr:HemK/PrmC family methyltransferase [Candidatus Andersenbacteria bacterium]